MPVLMQFIFAPLSLSASVLTEISSTTSVTMEYHFWKLILEIALKNCVVWISTSEILGCLLE